MSLVVLLGASGSGKTSIARSIADDARIASHVFYFDSIGVPSAEDMAKQYGSREAWQRTKTIEWMIKLASESRRGLRTLFEGQTRFSFIAEGALAAGGVAYRPILVDCDDATRSSRLMKERKQPELANAEMMRWARFLREEARLGGYPVLDTSALSLSECVETVLDHMKV